MSKSRGTVVSPMELKDKYGLDAFRYFLLRDMVFGLDSNFSEENFVQRLNSDLANDLGNLVSRTLAMAVKYCDGKVPKPHTFSEEDTSLIETAGKILPAIESSFCELAFHKALISIWNFINTTNKYIVTSEPWLLAKDPDARERLETVIYNLLESLRVIAVFIYPFMPDTSEKIMRHLGIEDNQAPDLNSIRNWGGLKSGNSLTRGPALFPRVEYKDGEEILKDKETMPEISYEDFQKVDIKVARIVEAEAIPKSDKLLKLKVDIGEERIVVAGIAKDYKPEELIGKKIAVITNLKPVKLMGVESRGMLLAADTDDGLTILSFDGDAKTGAKIK